MTIKINERFSVERDPMQWVLVETRPGESRDGKPIENTYRSCYYQFSILCADLIEKCPGQASDLRKIVATIKEAKTACLEAVQGSRLHDLVKSVAVQEREFQAGQAEKRKETKKQAVAP